MRDEQDGATAEEVAHPREEIVLGARVERRGRLVQDDERSISEEGAGEGDALPLAYRDVLPPHEIWPQYRVVRVRPRVHERIGAGPFRRSDDGFEILEVLHPAEPDVLAHREHEPREILEQHGDALVDPALIVRRHVLAIPEHAAGVGAVETREHFRERGLTRSVLADESDHFAGPDLERHIVEREARWKCRAAVLRRRWWIAEGHVVEVDAIERRGALGERRRSRGRERVELFP